MIDFCLETGEAIMALPEPIKPLGKKEAKLFLDELEAFEWSEERKMHFRRLRDA